MKRIDPATRDATPAAPARRARGKVTQLDRGRRRRDTANGFAIALAETPTPPAPTPARASVAPREPGDDIATAVTAWMEHATSVSTRAVAPRAPIAAPAPAAPAARPTPAVARPEPRTPAPEDRDVRLREVLHTLVTAAARTPAAPVVAVAPPTPAATPSPTLPTFAIAPAAAPPPSLHAAPAAAAIAPPPLEPVEAVEEPAPTGALGHSIARVTVGDGADRVSLTVATAGHTVRVTAVAEDVQLGNAIGRGADDLATALARHGLALGDLSAGSRDRGPPEPPRGRTRDTIAPPDAPTPDDRPRAGVRVVA